MLPANRDNWTDRVKDKISELEGQGWKVVGQYEDQSTVTPVLALQLAEGYRLCQVHDKASGVDVLEHQQDGEPNIHPYQK